jgi:hypothetical protein
MFERILFIKKKTDETITISGIWILFLIEYQNYTVPDSQFSQTSRGLEAEPTHMEQKNHCMIPFNSQNH